jgi:protein arginine N-methyltransferase 1
VYSLAAYGRMLADRVRTEAYARALERTIQPSSVVLDIGTGTGIMALFAARLGARRVYAVESSDVIQVARDLAAANGYADRIEFIQDLSTNITLPERADVLVADLHGVLPLYTQHLPAVADARERHLVPGATQIPRRETLWVGLVEASESYRQHVEVWTEHSYDFDVTPLGAIAPNDWWREPVPADEFLAAPVPWATLDYTTLKDPDVSGEAELAVERPGTAHGLSIWFDSELTDSISFSNGPDAPDMIFGHALFALTAPVVVEPGDLVRVRLDATLLDDEYVWRWRTTMNGGEDSRRIAAFDQSTLTGLPLSLRTLHRSQSTYVPRLGTDGEIDRLVLELMGMSSPLGEISRRLSQQFPDRFATPEAALRRVAKLSQKYSL